MSLPSSPARPSRLSGRAPWPITVALLVALTLVLPAGQASAGAASPDDDAPPVGVYSPESERWGWPVDGARVVVRTYEAPPTPYGAGHRGIDVAASVGVPVVASSTGVVHFAGRVVDRGVVSVRYSENVIASVEPVTPLVAEGQSVAAGEVIATVDPGHCAAPCLHLGVRVNGEYVSPLAFLEGIPRSILLPTRPDG